MLYTDNGDFLMEVSMTEDVKSRRQMLKSAMVGALATVLGALGLDKLSVKPAKAATGDALILGNNLNQPNSGDITATLTNVANSGNPNAFNAGFVVWNFNTGAAIRAINSSGGAAIFASGPVGIGTLSPAELLHVFGASGNLGMRFGNGGNGAGDFSVQRYFMGGVEKAVVFTHGNDMTFRVTSGANPSGNLLLQDAGGKVGIGTTTPTHLIQLAGGAFCDGTGAWIAGSSVRWKENIEPLADGVDTLRQLHPVSYNRKETPSRRTMGFIAEEVGKVLPTIVDWDEAEPGYAEGYDHLAILALTVEAIKEQQKEIEQLKVVIKEQSDDIRTLHETVKGLSAD